MKATPFILGTVAIFAGVVGALQFDKWLDRKNTAKVLQASSMYGRTVEFEEQAMGAGHGGGVHRASARGSVTANLPPKPQ